MATETTSSESTADSTETVDQTNQAAASTGEENSSGTEEQASTQDATDTGEQAGDSANDNSGQGFNKDALLADLHKERDQRKALGAQVESLTADLAKAKSQVDQTTAVQRKYDRLESFLSNLGGPISKALDSKSFSSSLFESDTDTKELVAQWHKDNPSATSTALNSGSGSTEASKDMNALLRKAAQ